MLPSGLSSWRLTHAVCCQAVGARKAFAMPVEAFRQDADDAAAQGLLFLVPHGPARPKGKAQAAATAKAKCAPG